MKTALFILLITLTSSSLAQESLRVYDASRRFDVVVTVSKCEDKVLGECDGKFDFFRKKAKKSFQTINLRTMVGATDSELSFADFNFDGAEDVAIKDGMKSAYITPSYQVYLFYKSQNKFVYSPSFTRLATGESMGLFEINRRKKTLVRESRVGCCYFWTETYDIVSGKPRKISRVIYDESSAAQIWAITTTEKLVNGRWRTWTKRSRILAANSSIKTPQ